jgi:RNA polymerase sigma factor (sigma-70 family)
LEASALQAPVRIGRLSLAGPLLRLRSDDQLVALFRAGSDDAFGVIHDRYRQRLFAYARQMLSGSPSDAEDAIQDVFIRAYSSLRNGSKPIALRPWLYRVAHNRCIDQLRKPATQTVELWDGAGPPADDPMVEAERREDLRRLVADMRRLPEQQRSVLLMRELEGLSYDDLAAAHQTSVAAIKSLLVRARVGLVQSAEARDTDCSQIRHDLALAHGRGVRANGQARRHLRDCSGCREYRSELKRVQRSFAALYPVGPLAALLKLAGIGGSGSGASTAAGTGTAAAGTGAVAAGGTGAAAGGGAAAVGGSGIGGFAVAATATKVAAVVATVALTGGAAVKVEQHFTKAAPPQPAAIVPAADHTSSAPAARDLPKITLPATDADTPADTSTPTVTPAVTTPVAKAAAPVTADPAPASSSDVSSDTKILTGGTVAPDTGDDSTSSGPTGGADVVISAGSDDGAPDADALPRQSPTTPSASKAGSGTTGSSATVSTTGPVSMPAGSDAPPAN